MKIFYGDFRKRVLVEDEKTERNSRIITGIQVAWMIYDHLKISDTDGTAPGPPSPPHPLSHHSTLRGSEQTRLWANLQEPAKEVVRMCNPQDFEDARRVERLLRILGERPLASTPVPDACKKIQAYDQIRCWSREVIVKGYNPAPATIWDPFDLLKCT